MEKREPISLFDDVPAGETVEKTHKLEQSGTIEKVWLRNYIGHGFDLRYDVKVKHNGRWRSLFEHLGKKFITGDDDTHNFDLREEVEKGDIIKIVAENNEQQHLYHANARVIVDYEGGLLGGLLDRLPSMLGGGS